VRAAKLVAAATTPQPSQSWFGVPQFKITLPAAPAPATVPVVTGQATIPSGEISLAPVLAPSPAPSVPSGAGGAVYTAVPTSSSTTPIFESTPPPATDEAVPLTAVSPTTGGLPIVPLLIGGVILLFFLRK
jgi:hypothetical protein